MGAIRNGLQRAINAVWHVKNTQQRTRFGGFYRPPQNQKRDFNAASVNNLTAGWNTQPITADYVTRSTLKILRARSREQFSNNDYARRFVQMGKNNVVGEQGIKMQSKSTDASGKPDRAANDAIEREWRKWGKAKNCDLMGMSSFVEMQKQLIQSEFVDGEYCVILHRIKKYPFLQLEIIDPELLDVDYNLELKNGGRIKFGVEYNVSGRPVAYWLKETNETGDFYTLGNKRNRIDARSFIHGYIVERTGQKRGNPQMATSLLRMNMQSGFENASLINARASASKMGFFTSPDGEGYAGDDVAADGSLIADAEPGSFEQLPAGVQFQAYDPNYPTGEFDTFNKSVLRGIASGLGVSYVSLANDLQGVSYSSIRQGVLDEREAWKGLQSWLIETGLEKIHAAWIEQFLAFGAIKVGANGTLPVDKIDKFSEVMWQARRWQWVDPAKDVKANIDSIDNGLRSRSDVIRESGRDPLDVWVEIERENMILKELGINVAAEPKPAPPQPEIETDDEVETDDDEDMRSRYERMIDSGEISPQPEYDELMRLLEGNK